MISSYTRVANSICFESKSPAISHYRLSSDPLCFAEEVVIRSSFCRANAEIKAGAKEANFMGISHNRVRAIALLAESDPHLTLQLVFVSAATRVGSLALAGLTRGFIQRTSPIA